MSFGNKLILLLICSMVSKTKLVVGLLETGWLHQMSLGPRWSSERVVSDRLHVCSSRYLLSAD